MTRGIAKVEFFCLCCLFGLSNCKELIFEFWALMAGGGDGFFRV